MPAQTPEKTKSALDSIFSTAANDSTIYFVSLAAAAGNFYYHQTQGDPIWGAVTIPIALPAASVGYALVSKGEKPPTDTVLAAGANLAVANAVFLYMGRDLTAGVLGLAAGFVASIVTMEVF